MNLQTWIRIPSTRKGDKCPVSGYSRKTLQDLIYGIPSKGIPPKVRYKSIKDGRAAFIHVPSLMQHLLGEMEMSTESLAALRGLAASPDWCQRAIHSLLAMTGDRAGLTTADFLAWLLQTSMPSFHELFPDRPSPEHLAGKPAPKPATPRGNAQRAQVQEAPQAVY